MIREGTLAVLPDGAGEYIKRRVSEAAGLGLIFLAALLLAALVTYDPADPSFNHATAAAPANLLGLPGSHFADLMISSLGVAALIPLLALGTWGWKVMCKNPPERLWLLLAALLVATTAASVALAVLPLGGPWPHSQGAGGLSGTLILDAAARALSVGDGVIAAIAALLALLAAIPALGVSRDDLGAISRGARRAGDAALSAVRVGRGIMTRLRPVERNTPVRTGGARRVRSRPGVGAEVANIDTGGRGERGEEDAPAASANIVAPKQPRVREGRKVAQESQGKFSFGGEAAGVLPPLDLLQPSPPTPATVDALSRNSLEENARLLATVLEDFGVRGEIVKVRPGPVITLYELEPAPGTKSSRVIGLADDIARSMSAVSARVAVVPGRNVIGIELPNMRRETVGLRELLASDAFERYAGRLTLAMGKDIGGAPVLVDLARMPHLLIAGTTGSGKSVAINAMILSLLYQHTPDTCKLILIDPKMLELSVYDGIPHLLSPVVTEPSKAVVALKWTVREMEERYRAMSQLGVRSIAGYNTRLAEARRKGEELKRRVQTGFDADSQPVFEEHPLDLEPLPLIVVVVDEMADLMLVAGKDIEAAVQRLSQMARAAGIHLIMATQRPSVDVITGTIKANFPTRVSFQVTSKIDSRTILGEQGAEQLLGQGDMLFMATGGRVTRVHGPFVGDREVETVVRFLKSQGAPQYIPEVTEEEDEEEPIFDVGGGAGEDELYEEAVALVARDGKASTSYVQRRLQIGYNRAARLIERMEVQGLVSKADRVGRREVLLGERAD
ncbi:MAG: DNA translocase FtsK 4TM domain-containing protein [Rhodospirillales bacterium]|nr:DNA translocase FtsK 4TM domain-containing protein [Rhodospirillales bacterium]